MVWGAISKEGKSSKLFMKKNMNTEARTTILADHLMPFIEDKHRSEGDEAILQQDNSSAHAAVRTQE